MDEIGKIYLLTGDNGSGKTRYLSKLSESKLPLIATKNSEYNRLICLSGTVYEKFPKPNKDNLKNIGNNYYYFGYKTNNNMFSEITPFRMVVSVLLNNGFTSQRSKYAARLLKEIGFDSSVKLEFRWARNYKENKSVKLDSLELDLLKEVDIESKLSAIKNLVNDGKVHLNKIFFCKNKEEYSVTELSSGERLFVLVILSLCFSVVQKSLILFDEPENSMHPKWQEKVTKVICQIFNEFGSNSKLIIATHSPLVVSSAPNNISSISDLNIDDQIWHKSNFNGNNADSILKEQFGMVSARSTEFVISFQKCISSMLKKDLDFESNFIELKSLNVYLDSNDPLYEAYNSILKYAEDIK